MRKGMVITKILLLVEFSGLTGIQGVVISEGMLGRIPAWRVERSDGEVLTIIKGQEVNYDSTTEGRKS